jgi:hypothetical protein
MELGGGHLLAANPVSGAIGGIVGAGVNAVFDAAGRWVADGALWLLDGVGSLMSSTTSVDLGAGWFTTHESVMAALAAAVVLPLVCCAAIQAIYRQSASMLVRAVCVHLSLALLFSGVAVELVRLGLAVTDVLSAQVLAGAGVDSRNLLQPIGGVLATAGITGPGVPAFIVFIAGILVAMTALVLWLELVVRAAAVSAAALFLPLALAGLVWPALSHWCRRLADTLAALVLSKLVVAAVLSLAASAIAGGLGLGASGTGGFASVVTGVGLLAMAAMSPFTLLRLVPAVEAGAVAHLESARHRLGGAAKAPLRAGSLALDLVRAGSPAGAASELAVGTGVGAQLGSAGLSSPSPSASPSASGSSSRSPRSPGSSPQSPASSSGAGIPMLRGTPAGPAWDAAVASSGRAPMAGAAQGSATPTGPVSPVRGPAVQFEERGDGA